jgi:WD40 repeat protein
MEESWQWVGLTEYDAATGRELPQSKDGWTRGSLSGVQFGADGKTLATRGNGVTLWNIATQKPIYQIPRKEFPRGFAISPNGKLLATLSYTGALNLWDAVSGAPLRQLAGSAPQRIPNLVPDLVFSPDSSFLAAAAFGHTIGQWDLVTGEEVKRLSGHDGGVYALAYSSDGKSLWSTGIDRVLRHWEVASGKELQIGLPLGGTLRGISSAAGLAAVRPDGNDLHPALRICKVTDGSEIRFLSDVNCNWCVFAPDGKTLAVGASNLFSPDQEKTIHLIEVATGKVRARFTGHLGFLEGAAFSPDGRLLASVSSDTTALIWDVTGRAKEAGPTANPDTLWDDLASSDAASAFRSIWVLADGSDRALPFLRAHLQPVKQVDTDQVRRWITELDSRDFKIREAAAKSLEALEDCAEPSLRDALDRQSSAEARRSIGQLLDKLKAPVSAPQHLQMLRAIEVLEHIGGTEAMAILKLLATGAPQDRATVEASASLERLSRRAAAK